MTNMHFFRLSPAWDAKGDNPYPWVDTADGLFGPDGLHKLTPLLAAWSPPRLVPSVLHSRMDAYCCPGGIFVFSSTARAALAEAVGTSVEWLPVDLAGLGDFALLHPLRACPLGRRAKFRRNEVSRNITHIEHYDFQLDRIGDATVFYPEQPPDSAAAAAGFCCRDVIASELPALIWERSGFRGLRFQAL